MKQLEKDVKHIITCWLDYNRLNYQWNVTKVKIKSPGDNGWTSHLYIELKSTSDNPFDIDEEPGRYELYEQVKRAEISHSQQDKITHIADIAFPIIFYETLRLLSEQDEKLQAME